jgi:putative endonuclease
MTYVNKFKPWELAVYIALSEKPIAEGFERYLKSGSGRVFVKNHLLSQGE